MLTVYSDNRMIETNYLRFSDGAIAYKLDTLPSKPDYITVNVDPSTPVNEIREELTVLMDCFTNFYSDVEDTKFYLNIPYMPYGRADRRFEDGCPFPLLGFMVFLGTYDWTEIRVRDMHNNSLLHAPVGSKVLELSQLNSYLASLPSRFKFDYDFVVAPDKGAMLKATTIADHFTADIVFAGKTRDVSTGRITAFTLPDIDFEGRKVLIPDDIFDGGGTFVGLAKELKARGAIQVDLYVTHLIAAKGLKMLDGVIDTLYYYHIVGKHINNEDVLNFNNKNI